MKYTMETCPITVTNGNEVLFKGTQGEYYDRLKKTKSKEAADFEIAVMTKAWPSISDLLDQDAIKGVDIIYNIEDRLRKLGVHK